MGARAWRQGFSFVELMISLVVMMVLGGMVMVFGQSGRAAWMTVQTRMQILSDTQRAINRVSQDLRNASQASLSCPGGEVLQMARTTGETIRYTRNATGLLRAVNGGAPAVIAARITQFTPTCNGGLVRFALSTTQDVQLYRSMESTSNWDMAHRVESQVWMQNP